MEEQVDRRGFLRRIGRRDGADDAPEAEAEGERELTPQEKQLQGLAEFSAKLLTDFGSEDEVRVADGPVLTRAWDQAYMRVTDGHIVYASAVGSSASIRTSDVVAFETQPAVDARGHGSLVVGVLRAHHPADLPTVTRSYSWSFPEDSPLMSAIRETCGIPEPEPESAEADGPVGAAEAEET